MRETMKSPRGPYFLLAPLCVAVLHLVRRRTLATPRAVLTSALDIPSSPPSQAAEAPRRPVADAARHLRLLRHGLPLASCVSVPSLQLRPHLQSPDIPRPCLPDSDEGGGPDHLEGPPAVAPPRVVPLELGCAQDQQGRGAAADPDGDTARAAVECVLPWPVSALALARPDADQRISLLLRRGLARQGEPLSGEPQRQGAPHGARLVVAVVRGASPASPPLRRCSGLSLTCCCSSLARSSPRSSSAATSSSTGSRASAPVPTSFSGPATDAHLTQDLGVRTALRRRQERQEPARAQPELDPRPLHERSGRADEHLPRHDPAQPAQRLDRGQHRQHLRRGLACVASSGLLCRGGVQH